MGKKVIVYSRKTCFYCKKAIQYLEKHGVDFEVVDVSGNPEKMKMLIDATGYNVVPQIEIDGDWIIGFEPKEIMEKLNN